MVLKSLDIFRERLSFEIENTIPEEVPFRAKLERVAKIFFIFCAFIFAILCLQLELFLNYTDGAGT